MRRGVFRIPISLQQNQAPMQSRKLLEVHALIVTIAQEGSFIRASRKLGVAAPSLTRRVAWLERAIGTRLFHRTSRKMELTPAGRIFVAESTLSLEHAGRAWNLARYQGQLENGPIRVGYSPYVHTAFVSHLFRISTEGGGASGIVLQSAPTLEEVKRVLDGQLHTALGIHPIDDKDLWVQRVGAEGFSVGVPTNHALARRLDLTAKDLNRERVFWLPPSAHPQFCDIIAKYLESLGIEPHFNEVAGQAHALELTAEGVGLALLPRSAARISRTGVVFKPLVDRFLAIETMLFMRRDQRYGRVRDFVDDLYSRLSALGQRTKR
jgi:LysR family transcriptional regulator, benzoate and cis,cis-muconate-responsive activator of ben and cat genes